MSPDRINTIKFVDWTLSLLRQEWMDAEGDKDAQRKWFDRINRALDMRVYVMGLVAYDHALTEKFKETPKPSKAPKKTPKPKNAPPEAPNPF